MSKNSKDSKVASSPERHTFQLNMAKERAAEEGKEVPEVYENWWKTAKEQDEENLADPEWQKDNLEYDLRSTEWIVSKAKASDSYAQNIYAALCNNDFTKLAVIPILKEQKWSCSWRHAGGIVADMQGEGDYINWYCSGIGDHQGVTSGYVAEGRVTEEIKQDLQKLGWVVVTNDKDD
jgi:hypothetical protein